MLNSGIETYRGVHIFNSSGGVGGVDFGVSGMDAGGVGMYQLPGTPPPPGAKTLFQRFAGFYFRSICIIA